MLWSHRHNAKPTPNALLAPLRRGGVLPRPPILYRTPCNDFVGATLAVARPDSYRISYNVSLRSQCAHWLWQSATPVPLAPLPKGDWHGKAVTGGFFPRTPANPIKKQKRSKK